jgi:hypothetical protein
MVRYVDVVPLFNVLADNQVVATPASRHIRKNVAFLNSDVMTVVELTSLTAMALKDLLFQNFLKWEILIRR